MTYDLTHIMKEAWTIVRRFLGNGESLHSLLARALKSAWFKAKMLAASRSAAAKDAARIAKLAARPSAEIIAMIEDLENTDKHDASASARLAEMRAALRLARTSEDEKRDLIANAKGRFCSVTFMKKDGTERTMQVQPARLARQVNGDKASDSGKRAVATRKATHPNLFPLWDTKANEPRSINLATILRIAVDGMVHTYPG